MLSPDPNAHLPAFQRLLKADIRAYTPLALASLTSAQMGFICRLLGVSHCGTRAEMSARILDAADLRQTLAGFDAPQPLADAFKRTELRAMQRRAGIWLGSNKYGAASSLLNWRNECRRRGQRVMVEYCAARAEQRSRPGPRQLSLFASPTLLTRKDTACPTR